MKCNFCGTEMEKLKTDKKALKAIKMLGVAFGGTWRCPNRMNHKRVGDFLSPKGESLIAINQNQKTIG